MFKSILVAVDGSEHAKQAVGYAASLAKELAGQLLILHVMPHAGGDRIPEALRQYGRSEHILVNESQLLRQIGQSIVDEAKDLAGTRGAQNVQTLLDTGDPAERIVSACIDRNIEVVVVGRRGLGDFASLLLGSVSHKVIQLAPCPCLTIPVVTPSLSQVT